MSSLQISTPDQEGVFQASRFLKIQVLCEPEELASLLEEPFSIYPLTGVVDGEPIDKGVFLSHYTDWIEGLKRGLVPEEAALRKVLACAWSEEEDALWLQKVPRGFLLKMRKPVIQVQAHFFTYSPLDGEFRPMSMGKGSIFWGLQFSFPQVYQHPKTMELIEEGPSSLFRKIQLWSREKTRATPFVEPTEGKKVNSPIRVGKNTLSWIGSHPQLVEQKIGIYGAH